MAFAATLASVIYALGWGGAYLMFRYGSPSAEDDGDWPDWLQAAAWPAITVAIIAIGAVLAYQWLDAALHREGV